MGRPHLPLSPLPWDYGDPREHLASEMDEGMMGLLQQGKDERPVGWNQGYSPLRAEASTSPPWWLWPWMERQAWTRPSVTKVSAYDKAGT